MARGTPRAAPEYMVEKRTAAGENARTSLLDAAAASRFTVQHADGEPFKLATASESERGRRSRPGRRRPPRLSDGLLGKIAVVVAISFILSIAIPFIICLRSSVRHKESPHGTSLGNASRRLYVEAGEEAPLLGDPGNPAGEPSNYLTFPHVEVGSDEAPPPYSEACPPYSVLPRPGERSFLPSVPRQRWQRFLRKFPFVAVVASIVFGFLVALAVTLVVVLRRVNTPLTIVSGFAMVYAAALIFTSVWMWMRNPGPVVFSESDRPFEHATGEEDRPQENGFI